MSTVTRVRGLATAVAVVGLVVVVVIGLVAALVGERLPGQHTAGQRAATVSTVPATAAAVPADWERVRVGDVSYAVPPGWRARPPGERSAYREAGVVFARGRGLAQSWANRCRTDFAAIPAAWAILAEPVRAASVGGVARSSTAAWARGYGVPDGADVLDAAAPGRLALADGRTGWTSRIVLDMRSSAKQCAGRRAELAAVAVRDGAVVRTLVAARSRGVRGAMTDRELAGVLASFRVGG